MSTPVLYLINYKDSKNPQFLFVDINTQLDSFSDLIKDSIVHSSPASLEEVMHGLIKIKNKVNFSTKGNGVEIKSKYTEVALKKDGFTVIALCTNLQGKRIGAILCNSKGELFKFGIDQIINGLRKKSLLLTNMFLRNGKELVPTQVALNTPTIILGNKISDTKIEKVIKTEKIGTLNSLKKMMENLNAPVKAMIIKGFGNYVRAYHLTNKFYPEKTLWFYYSLMLNGEGDLVQNMLTTEAFELNQLCEIADGLRYGLDIKKYANVNFDADEMRKNKEAQMTGMYAGMPIPKQAKETIKAFKKKGDYKKAGMFEATFNKKMKAPSNKKKA